MNEPSRTPGRLLALVAVVAAALAVPEPAAGQGYGPRPMVGGAPGWTTAFGGDAWNAVEPGAGVSLLAGVRTGDWRFGVVAHRSWHDATESLTREVDLLAVSGEVRRDFRIPESGLRFYLGGRAGVVHQEFDTSLLAVAEIDLVPGTDVSTEDTGFLFGPVGGVSLPVGGPFGLEMSAAYQWADVTPFILGPDEPDPGLSRALSLGLALTVGF